MKRKAVLSFLLFLMMHFSLELSAKDYYLSNAGNDKANGRTPKSSFKTLQRLNQVKLKPGDKVYFKSGDTFSGTLQIKYSGKKDQPILFTSYGEGKKPVISGAIKLQGFSKEAENIYSTSCEQPVKYLYKNGIIMNIARYPNTGFFTMDEANKEYLTDGDLPFSKDRLVGATVYVNIRVWITKHAKVKSNTHNKIVFDSPVVFHSTSGKEIAPLHGFNYFLDNKKEFLDYENEWYYSPDEKKVYIYSEKPLSESCVFKGTKTDNGIILSEGVSHVTIENLCVSGQSKNAISGLGNNKNIVVQNNEISMAGEYGIYFEKTGSKLSILNNALHDITGNGIRTMNAKNSLIEGNIVERIGTVAGYGIDGLNGATGICVVSYEVNSTDSSLLTHNCIIRNNYVSEIGYNGIRFEGYNTLVDGNVVKNCLLTMFDGGMIYTWSNPTKYTFNCTIKDNLVINNVKEDEGKHKIRLGIYLDYAVRNMVVENNKVINAGGGIMTNGGSTNSMIKNNLVYGCDNGLILIQKDHTVNKPHSAIGNTVVCLKNRGTTLSLANHRGIKTSTGVFDKNIYVSPDEKFHIKKIIVDKERKTEFMYTLKGWQEEMGIDKNSIHFVPEKDGKKYPFSDIFINEGEEVEKFILDPKYEYFDLQGNILENEVNVNARDAKPVFYITK